MRVALMGLAFVLGGCSVDTSGTGEPGPPLDAVTADTTFATSDTLVLEDTLVLDDTSSAEDTFITSDTEPPPPDTADTAPPPPDVTCPTCPALATCVEGACTCPTNSRVCSVGCVDEKADPNRCGSCDIGLPCAEGSMCANGVCACQPGLTLCGGVCIDMKGHAAACGGCTPCAANQRCVNGACVNESSSTCPTSRPDECPSSDGRKSCFNFNRDPMHCGGCATDKRCTADEFCVAGTCVKYAVGVGCTTCPCANCATILPGSRCCPAPSGSAMGRVMCVVGTVCPGFVP